MDVSDGSLERASPSSEEPTAFSARGEQLFPRKNRGRILVLVSGQPGRPLPRLQKIEVPVAWITGARDGLYTEIARRAGSEVASSVRRIRHCRCRPPGTVGKARDFSRAGIKFLKDSSLSTTMQRKPTMNETWSQIQSYEDIVLEKTHDGVAKVTINRPRVRNAFRPADSHRAPARFSTVPGRLFHRRGRSHRSRATKPFAPEATSQFAERRAMSETMACPVSTCSICKNKFARSQSQ